VGVRLGANQRGPALHVPEPTTTKMMKPTTYGFRLFWTLSSFFCCMFDTRVALGAVRVRQTGHCALHATPSYTYRQFLRAPLGHVALVLLVPLANARGGSLPMMAGNTCGRWPYGKRLAKLCRVWVPRPHHGVGVFMEAINFHKSSRKVLQSR